MGKRLRKQLAALKSRQDAYDAFVAGKSPDAKRAFHRPGSMNRHKGNAHKAKR